MHGLPRLVFCLVSKSFLQLSQCPPGLSVTPRKVILRIGRQSLFRRKLILVYLSLHVHRPRQCGLPKP